MVASKPLISVVIPTLNEERCIHNLLTDLTKQTVKPNEIFVVDGFSNDKTVTVAKRFKGVVVSSIKPSTAKQRNFGAAKSTGQILFFLDADVRLASDFLQKAVYKLNRSELEIACPFFIPYQTNVAVFSVYVLFNIIFLVFQKLLPSGAGTCLIVKSSIFKENPGFNSEFKFEDMEYIRRMGRRYKFGIITESIGVSDRRFRKDGFFKTTFTYLVLSLLFTFGLFKIANVIDYKFGNYHER